MFTASLTVVLMCVAIGVVGLLGFAWALWTGQFHALDDAGYQILDERDYRLARAWETAEQRQEREATHGKLVEPSPGEWGGRF